MNVTTPWVLALSFALLNADSAAESQSIDQDITQMELQQRQSTEIETKLEEMIVVGSRLPTEDFKVGRSVTVLDEATIQELGHHYAADLFRFIPGVAVNRLGGYGGLTQLRLRGGEGNHVLVLIDGIDVSAAGTGEFDFSSLLAADIERIEVLRGPQSGLFGSNALAGVISIHTKRPADGSSLEINLEGGDDNTRQGSVSVSGGIDRLKGRLTYTQRKSEFDLSQNDAVIGAEDDEDENQTLSGQLRMQVSEAFTVAVFGRHTEKQTDTDGFDFSGGPLQGLPIDDQSVSDTVDTTLGAIGNLSLYEDRLIARLAVAKTDSELDGVSFGSESHRTQTRMDMSWQWPHVGVRQQRTTLFVQDEEETFRNLYPFDPSQRPTQERDLLGYGIEHRLEFGDRIFLNGTARRDNNDAFEDVTTFAVDAAYLLNAGHTRMHASYGSGVTNPTFFEQFGFVPGTFIGNADLKPEKSVAWDVGVEQTLLDGRLIVDLTYFDADLEDEIQNLFPSVVNSGGDSHRRGAELSLGYTFAIGARLNASYTYTDATEPRGEEVRRPEHMASMNIAHTVWNGKLQLAGSVVYNGEQLDDDFRNYFINGFMAERTKVSAYTLLNINATYQVKSNIAVYLRIENLLDEAYSEALGYAAPGRTAFAGVRVSLGG